MYLLKKKDIYCYGPEKAPINIFLCQGDSASPSLKSLMFNKLLYELKWYLYVCL